MYSQTLTRLTTILFALIVLLAACGGKPPAVVAPGGASDAQPNMPNPAAVNCEKQGGKTAIVGTEAGQLGMCVFPDGSTCDEWALYRQECAAGQQKPATNKAPGMANPATTYCLDAGGGWIQVKDAGGNEYGLCSLPGGAVCEEWAFYRGTCKP